MLNNLDKYSFLDIQYVWFNNNQTVLFIADDKYNKENIERFNILKDNNTFIARAIDGKDVYHTKDIEHSISLYEHGYYDLLLKDYEILPYKRQYYSDILPSKMSLKELKERFAYNERRLKLYNDLEKIMSIINKIVDLTSLRIAGSFLEDKENPGDIDIFITMDKENFQIIKDNEKIYNLYRKFRTKSIMEKAGYGIHANVLVEEDVDLNNCSFDLHDNISDYICNRGYYIALYSQNVIYKEDGHECYIRNIVTIKE